MRQVRRSAPMQGRSQANENHTTKDYMVAIVAPAFAFCALMLAMMGGVL